MKIAADSGISRDDVSDILRQLIQLFGETAKKGSSISIPFGFGDAVVSPHGCNMAFSQQLISQVLPQVL